MLRLSSDIPDFAFFRTRLYNMATSCRSRRRRRHRSARSSRRHGSRHRYHSRRRQRSCRARRKRVRRSRRRRAMRGGYATNTLFPTFLVNGARSALTGTENIVNTYKGKSLVPSPYPTEQPNLSPLEDVWLPRFPDLTEISEASARAASSM